MTKIKHQRMTQRIGGEVVTFIVFHQLKKFFIHRVGFKKIRSNFRSFLLACALIEKNVACWDQLHFYAFKLS